MIKDSKIWDEFERSLRKKEPVDYAANLKIFDALWSEAIALGTLPLKDPLEGIETDIEIAKILNS